MLVFFSEADYLNIYILLEDMRGSVPGQSVDARLCWF